MHDAYNRRTKITRKASDSAKNLQLYMLFSSSTRDSHARRIYRRTFIKCVVYDNLGWKNKQLDIIADFLPRFYE